MQTSPSPTAPATKPVITTAFTRRHGLMSGFLLTTMWGTSTITPTRSGWHVYALIKGTATGSNHPTLRKALNAALIMCDCVSSRLLAQANDPSLITY